MLNHRAVWKICQTCLPGALAVIGVHAGGLQNLVYPGGRLILIREDFGPGCLERLVAILAAVTTGAVPCGITGGLVQEEQFCVTVR